MRKLIVGLIAVGLLAVAGPAKAQMADPLGLIASGAVIPYVGASGIAVVNSKTGALTEHLRERRKPGDPGNCVAGREQCSAGGERSSGHFRSICSSSIRPA